MVRGLFQHRSGRLIAVARALLSVFFLVAIWLDHSQPMAAVRETYWILHLYVAFSLLLVILTWNDWWLESRLAAPAHALDLLVFLWINHATQGYASPFFTFFVFLVLSASIRWGWRGTAITAAVILLLYIVSAVSAATWGTEAFQLRRFTIRSSYLVALSAIVILWLVSNQRPVDRAAGMLGDAPDTGALLRYVAARFNAPRALFVWSETEEPWVYVASLEGSRVTEGKVQPGSFEPATDELAGEGPFLFDQRKGRVMRRRWGRLRSLRDVQEPVHPELSARYGATGGLRIPLRSAAITGNLFVFDVPGLCSDDLPLAEEAGERLAVALEHRERFQATEDAAALRAGLALARDLHDSVVQFLAGLTFRLEGMKKIAAGGRDVSAEVEALQQELVREQRDLRRLIADLRSGGGDREARVDLSASLRKMGARTAAQWDVACRVAADDQPLLVPLSLERNVGQLVREAVANAVRHGGADRIDARLAAAEGSLQLEITDNGTGFPINGEFADDELEARRIGPSSLRERVHNLGGTLRLHSSPEGASVKIILPLED